MLLKNQWVNEVIKEDIRKYSRQMEMEKTFQNLWDAAKAVQIGKFMVIQAYVKKQENLK